MFGLWIVVLYIILSNKYTCFVFLSKLVNVSFEKRQSEPKHKLYT